MKRGILGKTLAFVFAVGVLVTVSSIPAIAEDSSAAPAEPTLEEGGLRISVSCMEEGAPGITSFATLQVSVEGREDTGRYLPGDVVTLTAEYAPGYLFTGWFAQMSEGLTQVSEESSYTMTVAEDTPVAFVAVYAKEAGEADQTYTLSFSDNSCIVSGDGVIAEADGVYRVVPDSMVTISPKDKNQAVWGYKQDGSFVAFQNVFKVEKDTVLTPVYQDSGEGRYLWVEFYDGDTSKARIMARVKDGIVYSVSALDDSTLLSPENFAVASALEDDQRSFQGWLANGTTYRTFDHVMMAICEANGQIRFDALWS